MVDSPKRTFKTGRPVEHAPSDPESLFRDLRGRSPEIKHLWSHQADLLRAYDRSCFDVPDVALELPTGAGKTMVGLLLAEYRRRKARDRVVYLCPTRQLAHQVHAQASSYGLTTSLLLPAGYEGLNDYRKGDAIGIATYKGLFNTNPRINDPQTIICDDAHAGEGYISGLWSLSLSRAKRAELYRNILDLLAPVIDGHLLGQLLDDEARPADRAHSVELLPLPRLWPLLSALRDLLVGELEAKSEEDYGWQMVQGHLHACCLFVSWHEILIRPVVPPTHTHASFADARQRIYMSATLGAGGELERIMGVGLIRRLAMPEGWERQQIGRRFFLFPNASLDDDGCAELVAAAAKQAGRCLVLTPRFADFPTFEAALASGDVGTLRAEDIEAGIETFSGSSDVALLLANRYDGLDLPGDTCRLMAIHGLPVGTNLLEQFLYSRLGTMALLNDRIRTRFTQGVGRCCRGDTDYAAVLVTGQSLYDFCARREQRLQLHPELQAEIEFGLENSDDATRADFLGLLETFFEQGEEWARADADIQDRRGASTRTVDDVTGQLAAVVAKEIKFGRKLWGSDFVGALEAAKEVAEGLTARGLDGYRAWWYYLAGCAAFLQEEATGDSRFAAAVADNFRRAAGASHAIAWFARLADEATASGASEPFSASALSCAERAFESLASLGLHGKKFERDIATFLEGIMAEESRPFELALETLGRLLGFESRHPVGKGVPDGIWSLGDKRAVCFEAKSDETPGDGLSIRTLREAAMHPEWLKAEGRMASDAGIETVIVSPRETIDPDAIKFAGDLKYVAIKDIRDLATRVVAVLRRVRNAAAGADAIAGRTLLLEAYRHANFLPEAVWELLTKRAVVGLPCSKR